MVSFLNEVYQAVDIRTVIIAQKILIVTDIMSI